MKILKDYFGNNTHNSTCLLNTSRKNIQRIYCLGHISYEIRTLTLDHSIVFVGRTKWKHMVTWLCFACARNLWSKYRLLWWDSGHILQTTPYTLEPNPPPKKKKNLLLNAKKTYFPYFTKLESKSHNWLYLLSLTPNFSLLFFLCIRFSNAAAT